jgi:hypothetical protein
MNNAEKAENMLEFKGQFFLLAPDEKVSDGSLGRGAGG